MSSELRPTALHIITGLNDGGAEAVLFNLIQSATGFEHKVISLMGPGKYGPLMEAAGFEVACMNLSPKLPSPIKFARLVRQVRAAQPDVVQTWMYHADLLGGLAAWRTGARAIVWGLHHSTLDRRQTKWTTRVLVRLNARLSDWLPQRIVHCSSRGAEVHRAFGYAPDKLKVIPNGYDTDAFKPDPDARARVRAEFGIGDAQLLLGSVARYNPQKDHRNLILAFAELSKTRPDAHLLLVGPGLTAQNDTITGLLTEAGVADRVSLAGPRPDIPAVMNGLDLHVLASAFGEAFPNVLSEAMSCGTPCVATDVGDAPTIIGDTGSVCPPRDPNALARAILDAASRLGDPGAAKACRDRIVENFALERMVARYQQIWRESMINADTSEPQPRPQPHGGEA